MAITIQVQIDDERELVLNALTAEHNATHPGDPPVTPTQVLRAHSRDWLDQQASRLDDLDTGGWTAAFRRAPTAERAAVKTILEPYRR